MSSLGGYPPQPAAPEGWIAQPPDAAPGASGGGSSEEIPLWIIGVACVVLLGMLGALVYIVVGPDSSNGAKALEAPSYPQHWDKRILPEVRIAEEERGLQFEHPVRVRFLSPAAFRKTLSSHDKVTAGDRKEIAQETGLLRAMGLISGKVDLLRANEDFGDSAILAYYSFETESVTVRGRKITPSMKATLVHELTHVLQDQRYHLGARLKALSKASKTSTNEMVSVLSALGEGDAQRVEHRYVTSLRHRQRVALLEDQQRDADESQDGLASVPEILVAFESSPYILGEGLVTTVAEDGGNGAVADLFRHPPAHDIALLDPFRVVEGDTKAVKVPTPAVGHGEEKFDSGGFGALSWYLMLSARLPHVQALSTVDGWGGDAYVGYQSDGRSCVRANYRGRTSADTTAMQAALRQWAAAPGSTATVSSSGGVLTFQSCDPGTGVQAVNDDFQSAIQLVATRTAVGVSLLRSRIPTKASRCMAGELVQTYSPAQLTDPTFGRDDLAVQARMQQIAAGCR